METIKNQFTTQETDEFDYNYDSSSNHDDFEIDIADQSGPLQISDRKDNNQMMETFSNRLQEVETKELFLDFNFWDFLEPDQFKVSNLIREIENETK